MILQNLADAQQRQSREVLVYERMKTLAKHVASKLEERPFFVVFEGDLERCSPSNEMTRTKRKRESQSFAESQGWTAAVLEGGFGMRAVFREGLELGAVGYEGEPAGS